ncbi:major capsid protein P2 [Vibrio fluvialis]|uniref:major capsid protein P2 n=1 Tax=Vibrio fluvialis TaxID=676 RepID=UPI0024E037AA|nr:major capsid protein P2 [Vibrio fluvialis]WIE05921.1 major capsid protein P2 [Vibrio fluvialis]
MARITRKCPSFSNVQAGSTATLELPLGLSYHIIHLYFGGATLAQLKNIRIEADGKPIKKWEDGNRLNAENKHYGRGAATADCLPIFFTRQELKEIVQQRLFALGTQNVQTLSLLVDIDAAAVNPTLKATSIRGPQAEMGYITRIMEFKHSSAVSGEVEIDNIPLRAGSAIAAIHIYSADVTDAALEIDGGIVWEMSKTGAAKLQTDHGRDPQSTSKLSLDFLLEGDFLQAVDLQGVQDFRLKPTLSKAGSMTVVVEYLEQYNPAA